MYVMLSYLIAAFRTSHKLLAKSQLISSGALFEVSGNSYAMAYGCTAVAVHLPHGICELYGNKSDFSITNIRFIYKFIAALCHYILTKQQ